MQLKPFQTTAVASIASVLRSSTSALLQSPTGSGKTVIASAYVREYLDENSAHTVLCVVPTQSLVDQVYRTLKAFGVTAAVLHDTITRSIDGTRFPRPTLRSRVIISMPETFLNTVKGTNTLSLDATWAPTLLLVDEVHKGTSSSFQAVRNRYAGVRVLGLTATPYRAKNEEGEHLQDWFGDNIIRTIGIQDLIDVGQLVQPRYYSYKSDSHVFQTWDKSTRGQTNRRTIIFSKDTEHSFALRDAFVQQGVQAEVITGGSENLGVTQQTPLQRQEIFTRFNKGHTEVLISMYALCEGFDEPLAEYCMILREVGNIALYQQMVGRVLRCAPGKKQGVILDFGSNVKNYGPVESHVWEMQEIRKNSIQVDGRTEISFENFTRRSAAYITCTECNHVYDIKAAKACKHCGVPHGIKVTAELGQHMREHLSIPVKDAKALGNVMSRIKATVGASKELRVTFSRVANRNIGVSVFDETTGAFNEGFEFLAGINHSRAKLSDKVVFN
jgi:superfamily II DNA or RNA helicase